MLSNSMKRSSNFSVKEIKYLIQLVDSKKDIIESKKSDRATSDKKIKAWMEIEEQFNESFEDYRSFKVLKTKYDNLKKNLRRKMPTLPNLSILKIMRETQIPVFDEPLSDFDNDLTADGNTLHNSNDSDLDLKSLPPLNEEEFEAAAEEYVFETLSFSETHASSTIAQQNTSPKPRKEQSGISMESKKTDVWEEVAHKKLRKLELELKVIEEEWILRKQKLELEIETVRIESRLKEEKLQLEVELLKQKLQVINNNAQKYDSN